jgi:hypothetical protein
METRCGLTCEGQQLERITLPDVEITHVTPGFIRLSQHTPDCPRGCSFTSSVEDSMVRRAAFEHECGHTPMRLFVSEVREAQNEATDVI